MKIVFDGRWHGEHGIGRFSHEIRQRLDHNVIDIVGNDPVSMKGLLNLEYQSLNMQKPGRVFFSPGFTPPILWRSPLVFTVHDLIHLDIADESSPFKASYYNRVVRPALSRARAVLTVSNYSRQRILDWGNLSAESVKVVGNGVGVNFSPEGAKHEPGYPYILYICNNKPHKNVVRLLHAIASMENSDLQLVLSGYGNEEMQNTIQELNIQKRVIFAGRIPETELPNYYRGAAVVTMPSLYEGFGLPALEGMASGVPVVVSNVTSLPEVVGDAGILVDPYSVESIVEGLNTALYDSSLRIQAIERGLRQAERFSWEKVADKVNDILEGVE